MSGPPQQPPSRTASVGPPNAGGMNTPHGQGPPPPPPAQQSQNLNQIVLEYLSKKGYSRTEAMLRRESANVDAEGRPVPSRAEDTGGRKYFTAFDLTLQWIDNALDIYKPELKRLLWPLFVYSFIDMLSEHFMRDSQEFFKNYRNHFEAEHENDVRALAPMSLPEHVQTNDVAKLYRNNKYRLTISNMAFMTLTQFLESKDREGGATIIAIMSNNLDIRNVDRAAAGNERSLARLLGKQNGEQDVPAEDEGIPGHHPGSANLDRNAPSVLSKLSLGPMPMEQDLMDDVKAELQDHDTSNPPAAGQNSLVDEFEHSIKREPMDDVPSRDALPLPPSTSRDVAMEVQKIRENRDRFHIDGRSSGVGPGLSVTMFTFHNTFDSVNCIEFSGDNSLAAVGTAESYIRVWSLDNQPLTSPTDPADFQPSSSRRLIGHSGPVYSLSFAPSVALPQPQTNGHTNGTTASNDSKPRYMLSSSADSTIRLWSLDTWSNLVVYKSHSSPVWDVRFGPFGHYFVSCSSDRTARLWSTPNIAPLRLFVGHDADVEAVAWHPNGAYVFTAAGGADRSVRMWSVHQGNAVRLFTGHTGNCTAIACAKSGKMLASADDRGEILLWDLATGRLTKRMRGHGRGGIWSLDWSVESTVLVSAGADGTVRVWDVAPNKDAGGKVIGEGGAGNKVDGSGVSGGASGSSKSKAKKDVVVSPDQISAFPTKKSPVYKVGFTNMNLVIAGGAYLP